MKVQVTFDDTLYQLVPKEPDSVMLDRAVAFALMVSLSAEYGWTRYMRDLWERLLSAAPTPPAQPEHQMTAIQVRDWIADWIETNTQHREFWTPEVVELIRSIEINDQ